MRLNELNKTIRNEENFIRSLKKERIVAYKENVMKQFNEAIPELVRMIIGIIVMILGMIAFKEVEVIAGAFVIFLGFIVAFAKDAFTK